MCGIAGFWNQFESREVKVQRLEAAGKMLKHRGPDGQGRWISENSNVGLVHRRLSIIDVNDRAQQPMISGSGQSVITFNGEIYNFKELASKLKFKNFRTQSDTEVLLEHLEQNGDQAIIDLDGMFAFAKYDQRQRVLFLAVDHFGKKPLYTFWNGTQFAFASEIKALEALGIRLEVEAEFMAEYLLFGSPFHSGTVFKNVRKLMPGYTQKIINGIPQRPQVYWDLPLGQTDSLSYVEAKEQLKVLIAAAVQKRLVADVPIGAFVSGGLDSGIVAYEAQRSSQGSLCTFSVGFKGHKAFDETRFALEIARKIGSTHKVIENEDSSVDQVEKILAHFDEPFPDSSAIPVFELCRVVSKNVKVALSGDGGDEFFGGYRRMQAALFTERWGGLMRVFLDPVRSTLRGRELSPRSRLSYLLRLSDALGSPLTKRLLVWNSYFSEESIRHHLPGRWQKISAKLDAWEEALQGFDIGQKILYFNAKTYLFQDLLPKMDRMSMYHGLEVRSPLLDRALCEFVFKLPTAFKFGTFTTKRILKDCYRETLGADIVDRRKQGFATPIVSQLAIQKSYDHDVAARSGLADWHFDQLLNSERTSTRYGSCSYALRAMDAVLSKEVSL